MLKSMKVSSLYILISLASCAFAFVACDEGTDTLPGSCPPGMTAQEAQQQGLTCIPADGGNGLLPGGDAQSFPDIAADIQEPPTPDIQTTEDTEVTPDVEVPEPEVEKCTNEKDDDGDGLIDCKDDDCIGNEYCVEVLCVDNHDNDFDGLKDCEDPDCSWHTECGAETCNDFYLCLTEDGCNCLSGVNCPEPGTPEYTQCQSVCVEDQVCADGCTNDLSDEYQEYLTIFQLCGSAMCNNIDNDKEYGECLQENCLEPYAYCFFNGPSECADFYFICAKDCDNTCPEEDEACAGACVNECINALGIRSVQTHRKKSKGKKAERC